MAGRKKGTPKTGGRQPGTRNKRTQAQVLAIAEYCKKKKYDPLHAMVDIAVDESVDIDIRMACHKEVAKYVHSPLRAIDPDTGSAEQQIRVRVTLGGPSETGDDA